MRFGQLADRRWHWPLAATGRTIGLGNDADNEDRGLEQVRALPQRSAGVPMKTIGHWSDIDDPLSLASYSETGAGAGVRSLPACLLWAARCRFSSIFFAPAGVEIALQTADAVDK